MKLDRLLAITMILIHKKRVQAKELAEMFDVSVRTIYRDIETINQAGIPIVSYPGANGGIGILESYRLDKNVLTKEEMAAIAIALKSVSTGYHDNHTTVVLSKIEGMLRTQEAQIFKTISEQVFIDVSPWDTELSQKEKITQLRQAIAASHLVSFVYQPASGEPSQRTVEPHTLILKAQKWYLYAYCSSRQDFRLFKVARIKDLFIHPDDTFQRREIALEQNVWSKNLHNSTQVIDLVLRFSPSMRHRVEEWFGMESITYEADGSCVVRVDYPEDEWLYGFVLSFGHQVEVIEPLHIRNIIRDRAQKTFNLYATVSPKT